MKPLIAILICLLTIPASAQTFGLGPEVVEVTAVVTAETFGLGDVPRSVLVATPTLAPIKQRAATVLSAPRTVLRSVTEAAPTRIPIVRRALRSWTDRTVGPWSVTTLTLHLRGELESPQHRGYVPVEQLEARTLVELQDIHDNLHEGWIWDGSARRVTTVQRTVSVQSSCPGGVCPTTSHTTIRRGLLWRR